MYNPADWYWFVAGSTSQVWSSRRVQYVPVTDADYLAWCGAGNFASRIISAAELGDVLMQQWLPSIFAAGIQIASAGTPALNGTYAFDEATQTKIAGVVAGLAAGIPGGGSTFNWPDASGTPHAFTAANFTEFCTALKDYAYSYTQALGALLAGGSASLPAQPVTIA